MGKEEFDNNKDESYNCLKDSLTMLENIKKNMLMIYQKNIVN